MSYTFPLKLQETGWVCQAGLRAGKRTGRGRPQLLNTAGHDPDKWWGSRPCMQQERPLEHLNTKLLLDMFQAQLCGAKRTMAASPWLDLSSCLATKLALPELMQVLMSMSLNCLSLFATGLY